MKRVIHVEQHPSPGDADKGMQRFFVKRVAKDKAAQVFFDALAALPE